MLTGYKVYIPKVFAEKICDKDTNFFMLELEDGDSGLTITPVLRKDLKVYETAK